MKRVVMSRFTPQDKIIQTSNKFGNEGIKKQQGTTRILYHMLPIDGRRNFRFFEQTGGLNFPFSNLRGNTGLQVGETIAVERAYFSVVELDPLDATNQTIVGVTPASGVLPSLDGGEMSFSTMNQIVMKPIALNSFAAPFNKSAQFNEHVVFEFDTQIVIQPLVEFIFEVLTGVQAAIANSWLRLTIEGVGSIIAPRNTQ